MLCKNSWKKVKLFSKNGNVLSLEQRKLLMKKIIGSQFGYSPLTWMFCERKTNARINHDHERALKEIWL